jgi:membrane protein DedA with SNARE-associated domain
MSSVGYLFGRHWQALMRVMQRFNIAVLIVAAVGIVFLWWRYRRQAPKKD